jgi:hypothetical protein
VISKRLMPAALNLGCKQVSNMARKQVDEMKTTITLAVVLSLVVIPAVNQIFNDFFSHAGSSAMAPCQLQVECMRPQVSFASLH